MTFLPFEVARREHVRSSSSRSTRHQRGGVLGKLVRQLRRIGDAAPSSRPAIWPAALRRLARAGGRRPARASSPPIFCAAATALSVALLDCRVVVLGDDQDGHQMTFASLRSLSTSAFASATFAPALRFAGSTTFSVAQSWSDVHAERLGLQRLERLLLRLHDVRQRDVARLVQAQVGGDDRRQLDRDRLEAAVDFARDLRLVACRARPSTQTSPAASRAAPRASGRSGCRSSSIACLPRITRPRLFLLDERLQQLRHRERLQLRVGLDQDRAVGADRAAPCAASPGTACTPQETAMISVARPSSFSRTASSTAISSKGFIDILTLAVSTPSASRP